MKFINLTKHSINLYLKDGSIMSIPVSRELPTARVETEQKRVDTLDGIPVVRTIYNGIADIPKERTGTYYIVSSLVGMCHPDRHDLLCPNTHPDEVIRDKEGNIIATKSFQVFWSPVGVRR